MDEKESVLPQDKLEPPAQKPKRGVLRWVLMVLLAFGLGALLIAFALYIPTRQSLDKAKTDLGNANTTITSRSTQITTLQTVNTTLQKNLDTTTLHMIMLEALSGARAASLAIAADDYAGARLSLIQASEALDTLSGLLVGTDQKDVFNAMQQSAAQALTDMKTNLKSAQPEMDKLTKNLVQLEANLFPNP
jgi:hypothetical protein